MSIQAEQRLIEEIGQRIATYSTALMRVDALVVNPLTDVFIGCGTFVQVGRQFGILTAHHVARDLTSPCRLGLILRLEEAESFMIDSDHFTVCEVSVSEANEMGHDLAFIELREPYVSEISATKQFVNLSAVRQTVLPNPLKLNQGAWFIWGAAANRNTIEPTEAGLAPIIGVHGLCGPGLAIAETREDPYDYIDIRVSYGPGFDTPTNFRGYSGGGLWQVRIQGINTDSPHPTEWIYSGIIIFQSETRDQTRVLTCHGRRSIYEYAYTKIQNWRA